MPLGQASSKPPAPHHLLIRALWWDFYIQNCSLAFQNVSDNDLGLEGARILSEFLQNNTSSLFSLQLSGEPMKGFPGDTSGKESACQYRRRKRHRFSPRVGKIPWRRKWQPPPVLLPGEFHGQRSLVGCSPWGSKRVRHH